MPPQIPFMRLDRQYAENREAFQRAVAGVFEHGRVLQGPEVQSLEGRLGEFFGMRYAAGVASGTDALVLALKALGAGPGSRIAVTDLSFVASASAIALVGATPVFVDVDPEHGCMREDVVLELVHGRRIDGIVAVHLYGQMMELREICQAARDRGVFVVEDAAQALGATRHGAAPGAFSDAMCLSFDPTKVIGAHGSGGAVLTNSAEVDARVRRLRYHGHAGKRVYDEIGQNSQLPTLQAAVLLEKLRQEADWRARRTAIARRYSEAIGRSSGILPPAVRSGNVHNYHKYVMRVPGGRDALADHLGGRGIATSVHYSMPLHRQPCFAGRHETAGAMTNAEALAGEVLSLPMYPELTDGEVETICAALGDAAFVRRA